MSDVMDGAAARMMPHVMKAAKSNGANPPPGFGWDMLLELLLPILLQYLEGSILKRGPEYVRQTMKANGWRARYVRRLGINRLSREYGGARLKYDQRAALDTGLTAWATAESDENIDSGLGEVEELTIDLRPW